MKKIVFATLIIALLIVAVMPFVSHNSVIVAKANNSNNKVAYLDTGSGRMNLHPIPYVPVYPIRYVP